MITWKREVNIVILAVLIFFVALVGALGVVWMRQQIHLSAEHIKHHEAEIQELERKQALVEARVAQMHNPEYMIKRVGSRLEPPTNKQVVWVPGSLESEHEGAQKVNRVEPSALASLDALLLKVAQMQSSEKSHGRIR